MCTKKFMYLKYIQYMNLTSQCIQRVPLYWIHWHNNFTQYMMYREYFVPTYSLIRSVMLLCIYVKVFIWLSNAIQSLWTLFMYIYLHPSNQKYSINSYMYIMQVHVQVCKMFHSILYMYSVCTLTSSNLEVKKKRNSLNFGTGLWYIHI